MKIATAAYPLDWLDSWAQYEDKMASWVSDAAGQGADLLVFPEYGAMELATLDGADVSGDLERCLFAVSDRIADADALHVRLADEYGVHILAASAPVVDRSVANRPVNRARLVTPTRQVGIQDKQIMTRFERDTWDVVPGGELRVFDTALGKIGVLICYDSEFPLLGRALSDVDVILTPSCTSTLAGYTRVRIGSQARALENQCVTAMSSIVGAAPWCPAVDMNTGRGAVFGPPDRGFPENGVLSEGIMGQAGWTLADVDLNLIADVRADGTVLNRNHWKEQPKRISAITKRDLR
jgi:predicted amidohydrolase